MPCAVEEALIVLRLLPHVCHPPLLPASRLLCRLVDKRREANGKVMVRTPPKKDAGGESGRAWLILKLQSLLRLEFSEGLLSIDPNDLPAGDRGCAAVKPQKRAPSAGAKRPRPKRMQKEKPPQPVAASESSDEDDADGSSEDESDAEDDVYKVLAILDARGSDSAEMKRMGWAVGTPVFLVAWEGWTADWNTWEPAANINPSLIADYEERQREADETVEEDPLDDVPLAERTAALPRVVEVEQADVVALSIKKVIYSSLCVSRGKGRVSREGMRARAIFRWIP